MPQLDQAPENEAKWRVAAVVSILVLLVLFCCPFALLLFAQIPPTRLSEAHARNPVWSPTGEYILAECTFGPDPSDLDFPAWELCASAPDLNNLIRLNVGVQVDWSGSEAVWSPDGKKVAFRAGGSIAVTEIPSGETRYYVTCEQPNWSTDGLEIVCSHAGSLFIVEFETNTLRRLTSGVNDISPIWIEGGTGVAFIRWVGSETRVYAIDYSGENKQLLAVTAERVYHISPSPNGERLVYPIDDATGLGLVEIQSGAFYSLLRAYDCLEDISNAEWSHNGQYIAFVAESHCQTSNLVDVGIWLYDLETSAIVWLTQGKVDAWRFGRLSWAPDDTVIATSYQQGLNRIKLFSVSEARCSPFGCD